MSQDSSDEMTQEKYAIMEDFKYLEQGTPQWIEGRKQFLITCSEFAIAIGISKLESRNALMRKKINPDSVPEKNEISKKIFAYGSNIEPIARQDLEDFLNIKIDKQGLYFNQIYSGVAGSHDGKIRNKNGIIEIKTKISGILPKSPQPDHVVQCLRNMEMWQVDFCILYYWTPGGSQYWIIPRDAEKFKKVIWPLLLEFMHKIEAKTYYARMAAGEKQKIINAIMHDLKLNSVKF